MKHTPGPWIVDPDDKLNPERAYGITRDLGEKAAEEIGVYYASEVIAEVCTSQGDTDLADARLIATAPELLEALEESIDTIKDLISGGGTDLSTSFTKKLETLVAKAKGAKQ